PPVSAANVPGGKATVEVPPPPESSHRISVPTHCGGKVTVRQMITLSSDWASSKSNGSGASGNPKLSVSPTSAGTSTSSVQKLAIPSLVVSARRTASGVASTSNVNSTSPMARPFILATTKAYSHFSLE